MSFRNLFLMEIYFVYLLRLAYYNRRSFLYNYKYTFNYSTFLDFFYFFISCIVIIHITTTLIFESMIIVAIILIITILIWGRKWVVIWSSISKSFRIRLILIILKVTSFSYFFLIIVIVIVWLLVEIGCLSDLFLLDIIISIVAFWIFLGFNLWNSLIKELIVRKVLFLKLGLLIVIFFVVILYCWIKRRLYLINWWLVSACSCPNAH